MRTAPWLALALAASACGMNEIGRPPEMTSIGLTDSKAKPILTADYAAMAVPPPQSARFAYQQGSLWNNSPDGLLGDKRARSLGDILTIVIEIDEEAEMRNTSERERSGTQSAEVGGFFGLGNVISTELNPNMQWGSDSSFEGSGSVKRNEKLTLRVAATVVQVLPNGHLVIQGDQEVRVNFELRDLQVAGIVRPADISRHNEIAYDRIAGARISYGGRGQITAVQQPRYGQQVIDKVMPY